MGNFYKSLDIGKDVVATRTLLHEAIPLTGSIVSGTYGTENIKNYAHGMFQSVYDYPYLSSSANHIFDITTGIASDSALTVAATAQPSKKLNIYNQMAQVLVGYDHTGSVQKFDQDGDILAGGTKLSDIIFINFSRLLTKDEIKKGSFTLTVGAGATHADTMAKTFHITDASGSDGYLVNSPVGEYGILFASQGSNTPLHSSGENARCGLLYYQAGICALTASIFHNSAAGGLLTTECEMNTDGEDVEAILTGSNIEAIADSFRRRINNLQFNNTVELNSSVYFCRVNHNEFNYSTNPTYLSGSKIRVKTQSSDLPVSYITTVGLYNDNNELLATAKLSEPLKKSSDTEFTIRVRLDY